MIDLDTFKKLLKNVGDLGELFVSKGFKKLPNLVTLYTILILYSSNSSSTR